MKQVKYGTANLFARFKAQTKVWLNILQSDQKSKRYRYFFLTLKAKKKGTSDVFTGSTALRKVSLIYLQAKMSEER